MILKTPHYANTRNLSNFKVCKDYVAEAALV